MKASGSAFTTVTLDKDARRFSVSWEGGYLTATVGLFKALYGADWERKVGGGKAATINVKSHTRQRVIGGPATSVAGYSYGVVKWPRKVRGGAAGGQPIRILLGEDFWTARLGGSIQDFKAFLAGAGAPATGFTFITEKGGEYSSAS